MKRVVILFFFGVFQMSSASNDHPKWDHLSVTFGKFSPLPMNENDAIKEGWISIAENCEDRKRQFLGKRYVLNGDYATILIFDAHGHIAGMQMAYKSGLKEGKYTKYRTAFQLVDDVDGEEYYYLTAYFTEPKNICDKRVAPRPRDVVGDKLMFRSGENQYMDIPLLEKDLKQTKWVLGKYFRGMGTHYWYDISRDIDCNDMFPFFLMYDKKGRLHSWGFVTDVNITGKRVERPASTNLELFFEKESMPNCMAKLKHRTTKHVQFTKIFGST